MVYIILLMQLAEKLITELALLTCTVVSSFCVGDVTIDTDLSSCISVA